MQKIGRRGGGENRSQVHRRAGERQQGRPAGQAGGLSPWDVPEDALFISVFEQRAPKALVWCAPWGRRVESLQVISLEARS